MDLGCHKAVLVVGLKQVGHPGKQSIDIALLVDEDSHQELVHHFESVLVVG
jgi:hypothetical protein